MVFFLGFGETHPLAQNGRIFNIFLILGGAFTTAAAVTSVIRSIVSGEVQSPLGRPGMEHSLNILTIHAIVCGHGRMGRIICDELAQANQAFVVVDRVRALVSVVLLCDGRVVQTVLRPSVLDVIDLASRTQHIEMQMEENFVRAVSVVNGKKLSESMTRENGIIVVAIKRSSGNMEFNPGGETALDSGDTLISLGHRRDMDRHEQMAQPA